MTICAVKLCGKSSAHSNYNKDGITFHRFPKGPEFKEKWINATGRGGDGWFPTNNSAICSRHFTEDSFYEMKNRRRIMNTAVPTLFLPILISTDMLNAQTSLTSCNTPVTTKRRRSFSPIASTPSASESPVNKRLRRRIMELKSLMKTKNELLRKIRDRNRRLKRKVIYLKALLPESEKTN